MSLHIHWQHIDGIHKALHYAPLLYTCSALASEVSATRVTQRHPQVCQLPGARCRMSAWESGREVADVWKRWKEKKVEGVKTWCFFRADTSGWERNQRRRRLWIIGRQELVGCVQLKCPSGLSEVNSLLHTHLERTRKPAITSCSSVSERVVIYKMKARAGVGYFHRAMKRSRSAPHHKHQTHCSSSR